MAAGHNSGKDGVAKLRGDSDIVSDDTRYPIGMTGALPPRTKISLGFPNGVWFHGDAHN